MLYITYNICMALLVNWSSFENGKGSHSLPTSGTFRVIVSCMNIYSDLVNVQFAGIVNLLGPLT